MRNIIFILLIGQFVIAQKARVFRAFEFNTSISNYFGENYLSKGHDNFSSGLGIAAQILEYNNFTIGASLNYQTLEVTNKAIGGNFDSSKFYEFQGNFGYNYKLSNKLTFEPSINISYFEMHQQQSGIEYDTKFYGNMFGTSLKTKYYFNKNFYFLGNLGYNRLAFRTRTSREFDDYFNNSNNINLKVGLGVTF